MAIMGKLIFLSAALVLLFPLVVVHGVRKGEWEQLSKNGQIYQLSKDTYAFDVSVNMAHCAKRSKVVALDPKIKDYTPVFNRELKALGKLGGGTLKLEVGTYFHSDQIVMPSYTCIVGSGIDRTFIKLTALAPRFRKAGSIRSMWTERITIMDLTQDGNRASQGTGKDRNYGRYGFFSELTNYVYLKNFRVKNNVFYGFDPHGSKKHWSYRLVMENCAAEKNGLDGFTIDQTVHASILNGYSEGNDRHGYNIVTGTQHALFRDCVAFNNGAGSGVGFGFIAQNNQQYGTKTLAFESCKATNNYKGALKLHDVYNVWVSDSVFTGTGSSLCYEFSRTRGVYLRRNSCRGVRSTRKFKLTDAATYSETGDGSTVLPAGPKPKPKVNVPVAPVDTKPDPTCGRGKRTSNACCAPGCVKCGGRGCGAKGNYPGGSGANDACCVTPIRRAGKSCATTGPPCLL